MNDADALVVGAGFAGLAAAARLREAGWKVLLLEKSRGLGGRAATRRIGSQPVDFGAQFFTASQPLFVEKVRQWEAEGLCRLWSRGFPAWPASGSWEDGRVRYCVPAGMTSLAKREAAGLEILREARVEGLEIKDGRLSARTANEIVSARAAILTAPGPQTLALAADLMTPDIRADLEALSYSPCWSLIVRQAHFRPPWPALRCAHPALEWIAADDSRRAEPQGLFVLHATPTFSREHFEQEPGEVARRLLEAAAEVTAAEGFRFAKVEHFHRWRYARVENPLPLPAFRLLDGKGRLVFAGDAFGEPKLESAWLSGCAAAEALLAAAP